MPKRYSRYLPGNTEFSLEEFPYYWISLINAQYVLNIDFVLKKFGLDNSRRRVLLALKDSPNASISELSDTLISKMSTTTKIVYRLKEEDLVQTFSCEEDARITRVILTDKGHEMVDKINNLTQVIMSKSYEGLTPAQIDKLNASLKVLFKNLKT